MPEYEIDEDLLTEMENISESAWEEYGQSETGASDDDVEITMDTEQLTNQQIAYLSSNPDYMQGMMTDLGIENAGDYTKFINAYDPWNEEIAQQKWELGKKELFANTRKNMLEGLGGSLKAQTSYASKAGFEGMGGDQSSYLDTMEDIDIEGAEGTFMRGLEGQTIDRDAAIRQNWEDYAEMFYQDSGDIYAQQQSAKGAGGKK